MAYLVHQKVRGDPAISGVQMKPPSKPKTQMPPMIGWSLEMVLDPEQELFKLARIIDWNRLEAEFGSLYCPDNGRPGIPIRLMADVLPVN